MTRFAEVQVALLRNAKQIEDIAGMDADDFAMDTPTLTVTDDQGRTLTCYIEHSLKLAEEEYVLLLPVDTPIEIFSWEETEDAEEEAAVPVEDDAVTDEVFAIAKAVLGEQNLTLKRSAITLTVEGDLPDFEEEEDALESDEDEEEELQLLASFYHLEQEYAIYTPLDPFLILARLDEQGQPQLLSEAEMEKLEPLLPMLEDQLFEELDD
jgi:Protein of unknown function (DUF3727)/Protein of unknown function (DUF1292)